MKERGTKVELLNRLAVRFLADVKGQDLIEYALMAGFVAVAAGAIMPGIAENINIIFSKVNSVMVLGAANYIIGSQPLHKRLFLRFTGIRGGKGEGIQQLEIVAARGRYLRPFAQILLALAALREKQKELARAQCTRNLSARRASLQRA